MSKSQQQAKQEAQQEAQEFLKVLVSKDRKEVQKKVTDILAGKPEFISLIYKSMNLYQLAASDSNITEQPILVNLAKLSGHFVPAGSSQRKRELFFSNKDSAGNNYFHHLAKSAQAMPVESFQTKMNLMVKCHQMVLTTESSNESPKSEAEVYTIQYNMLTQQNNAGQTPEQIAEQLGRKDIGQALRNMKTFCSRGQNTASPASKTRSISSSSPVSFSSSVSSGSPATSPLRSDDDNKSVIAIGKKFTSLNVSQGSITSNHARAANGPDLSKFDPKIVELYEFTEGDTYQSYVTTVETIKDNMKREKRIITDAERQSIAEFGDIKGFQQKELLVQRNFSEINKVSDFIDQYNQNQNKANSSVARR